MLHFRIKGNVPKRNVKENYQYIFCDSIQYIGTILVIGLITELFLEISVDYA